MDQVLSQCMHLSKKNDIDQLEFYLEKNNDTILRSNPAAWTAAIEAMAGDVGTHTYAITYFAGLRALQTDEASGNGTVAIVEALIAKGNYKQLRGREKVMGKWRDAIRRYTKAVREAKAYRRGMKHLAEAIKYFKPTEEHLSPAHAGFVQLALKGNNPKVALPLLAKPIYNIDPSETGVDALDYMSYYYYGALVYCAYHKWNDALRFFENCLNVPAVAPSLVMLEAFKVALLVGVIANGRAFQLPRGVSHSNEKLLRSLAEPYVDVVAGLESGESQKVAKALKDGERTFIEDNLMHFVEKAMQAFSKQHIAGLTRVYVTLPLKQVATMVGMSTQQVETLLREMITDKQIEAQINSADGTVNFGKRGSEVDATALLEKIAKAEEMAKRIQAHDEEVQLSRPFVMAKLRAMPNLKELLAEYEAKRKQARGIGGALADVLRGQ